MKTPKKVLLIEDDIDDQEFFIEVLNEIRNAVLLFVANNGKQALEQLNISPLLPDLIFSDIQMPLMNGIECLKEIKKNPRTRDIPVVMLTTDISQRELVDGLGAKGFIKKTDERYTLRRQLQEIIGDDLRL